jgi:uncharacterized delta-60 repeat protein
MFCIHMTKAILCLLLSACCALAQTGSIDYSFNVGTGANGSVNAITVTSNGTIYVAGSFLKFAGSDRRYIARLFYDGDLDAAFDPLQSTDGPVYCSAVQSDSKVFIGGGFSSVNSINRSYMARLRPDGSLDLSFPNLGLNGVVQSISILNNNQIVLVGGFTSIGSATRRNVLKLSSEGILDTTFNPGSSLTNGGNVSTALIQTDGKVLLAGNFTSLGNTNRYFIGRVNPNGSLDATFDCGFIGGSIITCLATQPDGKILVGGEFSSINGYSRMGIARVDSTGGVDTGFVFPPGLGVYGSPSVRDIQLQPDGKILVVGYFVYSTGVESRYSLVRLNPNGSLDESFYIRPNSSSVNVARLVKDGKVLIGGEFTSLGGTNINRIARLNNDGTASGEVAGLGFGLYAGMQLNGAVGSNYRVEYASNVNAGGFWLPLTNIILPSPSSLVVDPTPVVGVPRRFYRAVSLTP